MIKVVALDIYGTILASEDFDNELPPRRGIEDFVDKCFAKDISVVSASDSNSKMVFLGLEQSFGRHNQEKILFDRYYQLKDVPKDFSQIVADFGIQNNELFVIGDRETDIQWAKENGARFFQVPPYRNYLDIDNFDFRNLKFEE